LIGVASGHSSSLLFALVVVSLGYLAVLLCAFVTLAASSRNHTDLQEGLMITFSAAGALASLVLVALAIYTLATKERVHVVLSNSDDVEKVFVNGQERGQITYAGHESVDLGWLSPEDCITVQVFNAQGGYAWGIRIETAGKALGGPDQGTIGVTGANSNDFSHPSQIVHELTVSAAGDVINERTVMPAPESHLPDDLARYEGNCASSS
jgi:hypothetical protein